MAGRVRWIEGMRRGYTRLIILSILARKPTHGYEIMKTIGELFLGWSPSASAVYPMLHKLEEEGYIKYRVKREKRKEKKIYECTEKGMDLLKDAAEWRKRFSETLTSMLREYASEVLGDREMEISLTEMLLWPDFERMASLKEMSSEEKLEFLREKGEMLEMASKRISQALEKINKRISELEGKQ